MDPFDVNEILAREMFVQHWWPEGPWEKRREAWLTGPTENVRDTWRESARKLRLALAAEGVFVMRSRDA